MNRERASGHCAQPRHGGQHPVAGKEQAMGLSEERDRGCLAGGGVFEQAVKNE